MKGGRIFPDPDPDHEKPGPNPDSGPNPYPDLPSTILSHSNRFPLLKLQFCINCHETTFWPENQGKKRKKVD